MPTFFARHQKKVIWVLVFVFVVSVGLIAVQQAGLLVKNTTTSDGTSTVPTYAAMVNGDTISLDALDTAYSNLYSYYQSAGIASSDYLSGAHGAYASLNLSYQALESLIDKVLVAQEADKLQINVTTAQVEQEFSNQYSSLLSQNGITETDLEAYLAQSGRTLADFKDSMRSDVRLQLMVEAVNDRIAGNIAPTDDQLAEYFEKNISNYDIPEKIEVSHILVDNEDLALSLKAKLDSGDATFAELAAQYSQDTATKDSGGSLGWIERGQTVPAFEDVAFSLPIGQVSDPVHTSYGWHLILVTDHQDARTPTLNEVKDQVTSDYVAEVKDQRVADWHDSARASADVVIGIPILNAYELEMKDPDLGLSEYLKLLDEGSVSDPYLPYYIGRIYEDKANTAEQELATLQQKEEPTDDDTARMAALQPQIDQDKSSALQYYLMTLSDSSVEADETFLNRILALNPNSTEATYLLGTLYADRGDSDAAEEQFAQVIDRDPEYAQAYMASGDLAVQNGNYTLAETRYESALALRPQDSSLLLRLANVELALDELDKMETTLESVQAISPSNVRLMIAEGDLAARRLTDALQEQATLHAVADPTPEQQARLAELATEIDAQYAAAVAQYQDAVSHEASLDTFVKLGNVYLAAGHLDEAESEFRYVLGRSSYNAAAYEGLGDVLAKMSDTEGALDSYQKALARSSTDDQRERLLQKIIAADPTDTDSRLRYAGILTEEARWGDAIRQYSQVLEEDPSSVAAYLGIASAYHARGEYSTAIEYLKRGVSRISTKSDQRQLYTAMVNNYTDRAGSDAVLPSDGLDAVIELSRLLIDLGDTDTATTYLEWLQKMDSTYRADEVQPLLQAVGLGESAAEGTTAPGEAQTPSELPTDGQ